MFWQKIGNTVSDRLFRDSVRDSVPLILCLDTILSISIMYRPTGVEHIH